MSSNVTADEPSVPAWRYKSGLVVFATGNVLTLASPVVVPVLGLNPAYIAVAMIVGEIVILSSVFLLGWRGVKALKSKMFDRIKWLFRAGDLSAKPVGLRRFQFGIFLNAILANVLKYLAFIYVLIAYARATPEDPFPTIWGLPFEAQGWFVAGLFVVGELSFVASLFVLGDEWWNRFRNLFIWQGDEEEIST